MMKHSSGRATVCNLDFVVLQFPLDAAVLPLKARQARLDVMVGGGQGQARCRVHVLWQAAGWPTDPRHAHVVTESFPSSQQPQFSSAEQIHCQLPMTQKGGGGVTGWWVRSIVSTRTDCLQQTGRQLHKLIESRCPLHLGQQGAVMGGFPTAKPEDLAEVIARLWMCVCFYLCVCMCVCLHKLWPGSRQACQPKVSWFPSVGVKHIRSSLISSSSLVRFHGRHPPQHHPLANSERKREKRPYSIGCHWTVAMREGQFECGWDSPNCYSQSGVSIGRLIKSEPRACDLSAIIDWHDCPIDCRFTWEDPSSSCCLARLLTTVKKKAIWMLSSQFCWCWWFYDKTFLFLPLISLARKAR